MWCKSKFYERKDKWFVACCYITGFKSPNEMGILVNNVYILPSLGFQFNDWKFFMSFSWITFNAWFEYRNLTKKNKYL